MLQDLHFAHVLVLRDAGHQLLQLGVAVVHVVQQAQRIVRWALAAAPRHSEALLRHARAVFPERSHWTYSFHAEVFERNTYLII